MKINQKGIALIREFEGCKLSAYYCPAKIPTIGFGTTAGVKMGMTITGEQAEQMLQRDLVKFEEAIAKLVHIPLNENQFSALCVFVYNIGTGAFSQSTLLKKLNANDIQGAANEFPRWCKANDKELAGLKRRREAERKLFLSK